MDATGIRLHYVPFRNRKIEATQLLAHEVVTYRPLREWGGWGIRFGFGRGWASLLPGDLAREGLLDALMALPGVAEVVNHIEVVTSKAG